MMRDTINIEYIATPTGVGLELPEHATSGSAGVDIRAAIHETVTMAPRDIVTIPCGFSIAIPAGYEAQVRPRSGLARRYGVTVLNSPGTIDSDYAGEVMVILVNHGEKPFEVCRGMRIAQLVFARHATVEFTVVDRFGIDLEYGDAGARGDKGFGSTGVE